VQCPAEQGVTEINMRAGCGFDMKLRDPVTVRIALPCARARKCENRQKLSRGKNPCGSWFLSRTSEQPPHGTFASAWISIRKIHVMTAGDRRAYFEMTRKKCQARRSFALERVRRQDRLATRCREYSSANCDHGATPRYEQASAKRMNK